MKTNLRDKRMKTGQHDTLQTADLERAHRALLRLYQRAIELGVQAEEEDANRDQVREEAAGLDVVGENVVPQV